MLSKNNLPLGSFGIEIASLLRRSKLFLVTSCLCLLSLSSSQAFASTQPREFAAGYLTNLGLYTSAASLGSYACDPATGWSVEAVFFRAANADQPDVNFQCKNVNGVHWRSDSYYNWTVSCGAESASKVSSFPNGCVSATAAGNKPPQACPSSKKGNPIDFLTKAKVREETDYAGPQGLMFTRLYSSIRYANVGNEVTTGWRHNFSKSLSYVPITNAVPVDRYTWDAQARDWFPHPVSQASVWLNRPDGTALYFRKSAAAVGSQGFVSDSDVNYSLVGTLESDGSISEYSLRTPTDDVEKYDSLGRLSSINFKSGRSQSFTYSDSSTSAAVAPRPNLLIGVSDNRGRELHFAYDSNERMKSMTDPAGQVFSYAFDNDGNLVSVTHPDGLKRVYHYNESAYGGGTTLSKNFMTGISDEISAGNLVRYGIFKYSSSGYAVSTELANSVEKYLFAYDYPSGITDPLGAVRTYGYVVVNGVSLQTYVSQPAGAGCSASSSTMSYDANGNVSTRNDFNGVSTTYTYDLSRNLETSRVEASGTAVARTITTQWHPSFRLPLLVAEPNRITTYAYDDHGNQTSMSLQATTDANGSQGLAAVRTGVVRTRSTTYNAIGQPLTKTGPRTDVQDTTTYTYDDATGNLTSVTNPAGQVTTYSNYDAHGHPGLIVAPNGVSTELTYTPRGWLASTRATAGGLSELSQYDYDGVGHLTRFTAPDGSVTNYSYDAAERLVGISDGLGNSITYTLNAMGSRTSEKVTDPSGNLSRQISRTYDVLNRLQQVTGGVQ